jgi:hypothetical protein
MRMRRLATAIVLFLTVTAIAIGADAPRANAADARRASSLLATERTQHCHDAQGAALICFASEADRDADFEAAREGEIQALSSGGWVIAYVHASYAGSSVTLSQSYTNLGSIGWADVISSYKVYTSLTGAFYKNTSYGGTFQSYCCWAQVPYVGDTFNDTFSSFYLP